MLRPGKGLEGKIRNPKHEIRNKSEARNPKSKTDVDTRLRFVLSSSCFVLVSDFVLRISDLSPDFYGDPASEATTASNFRVW